MNSRCYVSKFIVLLIFYYYYYFFYVIEFDNCWELNSKGLFLRFEKRIFLANRVFCSLPAENLKLGSSTSWSCNDGKEMYTKSWSTCQVVVLLKGSLLSNDDSDVNDNVKKSNRLRLAKQQLCTCITLFFYISLPSLHD